MCAMDGEQLVKHLQLLEVPGAEGLVGESYDWLFTDNSAPLAAFLEWFTENISVNDKLTDEELNEYEALQARGEVLSGLQLEEMESCLSALPSLSGVSGEDLREAPYSEEELNSLENELEILTMRKNQLNAHKVELRERTYQYSQHLEKTKSILKKQLEAASSTSYHFYKAQEDLAKLDDAHLNIFQAFDETTAEEAKFFSQLDLEEWHQEEEKLTDLLKRYIYKQFREGVRVVAGAEDSSQYVLLDVNNLDLSLVRGAGEAEYKQNVQELKRLNKLLPQTEEWRLMGLLMQERKKAEVEEAERLLAAIYRNQLPRDVTMLWEQTREAQESLAVVEEESRQQQQVMRTILAEVAELKSTRTISGDYKLKLQRQEYFLDKQNIVMEQLVSQAARYNWAIIVLETEGQKISNMLEVLKSVNIKMTERDDNYKERMNWFEIMKKQHEEQKAAGQLPLPLHTLSHLLPTPSRPQLEDQTGVVSTKTLLKQVALLLTNLSVVQEQVATATNSQFAYLGQMAKNCKALETSLFGSVGSVRALPVAWLEVELAERYTATDQKLWEFKQKLLNIITQYENKKSVLQAEPAVYEESWKWIANVCKKLIT